MVLQVKQGILQPEDASRTVHGCAALLGLQLLKEVSKTTLIVTGLRKTAEKKFLQESFTSFGDIIGVAVAPGQRGFGKKLVVSLNVFLVSYPNSINSIIVMIEMYAFE